jgi:gamma-glutamyl:cysteine ligase YbdK (ATP-grasp superfamily)
MIEENKWRAMRDGLEAAFIHEGNVFSVPEFLDFTLRDLWDIAKDYGSLAYLKHLETMIKRGTPAKQILDIYAQTQDIHKAFSLFM